MKRYQCHKVVEAARIEAIYPGPVVGSDLMNGQFALCAGSKGIIWVDREKYLGCPIWNGVDDGAGALDLADGERVFVGPGWFPRFKPEVGGYFVRYADGYTSYSPRQAFEEGYTEVETETDPTPASKGY